MSEGHTSHEHNATLEDTFFEKKRAWSKVKDLILQSYLRPYLAKVKMLGHRIVLIDGYAGPGRFADGSEGSPLIICKVADSIIPRRYTAIFANKRRKHHDSLEVNLKGITPTGQVVLVNDDAEDVVRVMASTLLDHTVFAYLDPFASPDFRILRALLSRDKQYSTEILVNLNAQMIPRLAAAHATRRSSQAVQKLNTRLTAILGGEYWQPIFQDESKTNEQRLMAVASGYRQQLSQYLPYSGCCPVREKPNGPIKYFVVFCSRHEDAMVLMNDVMFSAYNRHLYETDTPGTLFEKIDWRTYRHFVDPPPVDLETSVIELVRTHPDRSRRQTWLSIIERYFMAFDQSEYKRVVQELCRKRLLSFKDTRGTGRLNDDSLLYIPDGS